MIPKELLDNVRRIEITSSRLVTDFFAGEYHSIFKGQGIEFDEVREYQIGDDVRTIDWNVTARTGRPHIKKFVEEREQTLMICVDASSSCRFASINNLKSQLAAQVAAILAFSAIRNHDKVGLIIFSDRVEKYIPPRKGLKHVLRIIREVLYYDPLGHGTDTTQALEFLNKVTHRKTIAFLISDFMDQEFLGENSSRSQSFKKTLSITNKKHDLIAITLNDPREISLPDCGLVALEDAETQKKVLLDTSSHAVREAYRQKNILRFKRREQLFQSVHMDYMDISTDSPYIDTMVKFFLRRKKRI